jgi:hypothetical protein
VVAEVAENNIDAFDHRGTGVDNANLRMDVGLCCPGSRNRDVERGIGIMSPYYPIEKIAVDLVIANLKENRLSAVAPPRPMLESRCEQIETYADVSTARRLGIMSHYCPALGTAKNLPNLVQNGGFSDVWAPVTPLFS